jgi:hypothetical protein
MARMNLEDEKPVKKQWSLKRLKLRPRGEGPRSMNIFPYSPYG